MFRIGHNFTSRRLRRPGAPQYLIDPRSLEEILAGMPVLENYYRQHLRAVTPKPERT